MDRPRASRLKGVAQGQPDWLSRWLPHGSLKRRLVFWLGVPIIALLLVALAADKIVMPIVTRQGSEFPLPDFVGKRMAEAQISVSELDLKYEVSSEEYSPDVPVGVIVRQYPKGGTKVKPDRTIKFVTSLGQKMVPVPELAGKSVRQAMLDLETADLKMGEIQWALSDTLPERVIVFSYPSAGFEVPLGSMVNLMVNRGRASTFTYMPKLVGQTLDKAKRLLEEKGLKLGVTSRRNDENYLPGTVLDQSEPEGAELDVGTEIDLIVSAIK
jgi:beta-lactam-binding protein with PASTA domain